VPVHKICGEKYLTRKKIQKARRFVHPEVEEISLEENSKSTC